jgi:hypothetical protein
VIGLSADRAPQLGFAIRLEKYHPPILLYRSEREHLAVKRGDPAWWEVRDAHDEAAEQDAFVVPLSHRG